MAFECILDSGAFSAWNQGKEVDLDGLIDYALANADTMDNIVALDVIPGRPGYKDIPFEEREAAAEQGYENYKYMLSKGLKKENTIVVFHQGDHFHWLERMRDEKIPYIGLSPANDRTTAEKMAWLDECMYYATDRKGFPLMKWHGFAVTSVPLIRRFPWYSVDSATWVLFSAYGTIVLPPLKGGSPDWYSDKPLLVTVSNSPNSKARKQEGKHFETLSDQEKQYVLDYLSGIGLSMGESRFEIMKCGTKLGPNQGWRGKRQKDGTRLVETILKKGVSNSWGARTRVNAYYFCNIRNSLPIWPWPYKTRAGFGLTRSTQKTDMVCPFPDSGEPTKIYFAGHAHEFEITERFLKRHGLYASWRMLVSYAYPDRCREIIKHKKRIIEEEYGEY